ncbi:MAG: cytidylate kinase-like family protein [Treponema sp.]|uniref:cytidylate kinase-like family protein n=1 Tax=uncultured Treponema sp. TaxID=162155 RepID=UPI00280AD878|nr:cytidylate kinase-like family protein [uncultured Treponema sp.]MEE0354029.1 cytidylate kinase-like family protein [Treponema sp.]
MAIIAISRQVAALGDEIAAAAAKKLGYTFITRKQIENRIVELGFPKEKLQKYDEIKPGFFASLAKGRDEYLNYLQYAVLEAASKGNCILIGRGSFVILEDVPNLISLRFVAKESVRAKRLEKEFNWTEKQAMARINESAANRKGFHKSFFNVDNEDSSHYMLTINTGILEQEEVVKQIVNFVKYFADPEKEALGKKRIENMLKAQDLTNKLLFEYKLNINFLRAIIDDEGTSITLQGVADSQAIVDRAVTLAAKILPSCTIKSAVNIVQDFKGC